MLIIVCFKGSRTNYISSFALQSVREGYFIEGYLTRADLRKKVYFLEEGY